MKKTILFIALLLFLTRSYGQQVTSPTPSKTSKDYLQKSRKQNTAAWIMLSGGTVLMLSGIVVGMTEATVAVVGSLATGEEQSTSSAGGVLFFTGLAGVVGSIPLFIASGRNRRNAASLSLNFQKLRQIQNSAFVSKPLPSLTLKFSL